MLLKTQTTFAVWTGKCCQNCFIEYEQIHKMDYMLFANVIETIFNKIDIIAHSLGVDLSKDSPGAKYLIVLKVKNAMNL